MELTDRQGALLVAMARAEDDGADLVLQSIDPDGSGPWRFGEEDFEWVSDADLRSLAAYLFVRLTEEPGDGTVHAHLEPQGRLAARRVLSERLTDMDGQPTTQAPAQHLPRRGDAVDRWLVEHAKNLSDIHYTDGWNVVNNLLMEYRRLADAGVTLEEDLEG